MGGSSKKPTNASPAAAPSQMPTTTVQPAMPGQLNDLAAQLGAGFGQSQPDMLAYLNQFYQPMQLPDYSAMPATPATGGTKTPAKSGPKRIALPYKD